MRLSRGLARGRCRGARPCVLYYPLLCVVKLGARSRRPFSKAFAVFSLSCASCARRDLFEDQTLPAASCGPRGGQEREAHEASLGSGSGAAAR